MYEEICYKRNYLTQVVVRSDFAIPITAINTSISQRFFKSIIKLFPIAEPRESVVHQVQVDIANVKNPSSLETKKKQWNFFGKNREKQLVVTDNSIFILYQKYKSFDDMYNEFTKIINAFDKEYPDTVSQRFGLRYVNNFDIEGVKISEWGKYISESLVDSYRFFENDKVLTRLFHIAGLRFDEIEVSFQFGIPNVDYPAIIKRPSFIVDIDAYVQIGHQLIDVIKYINSCHGNVQKLFEASITDNLRRKMNGQ